MGRAERRARTARIVRRRALQWDRVVTSGGVPGIEGRARNMSHLDCGKTQCLACHYDKILDPDGHIERQAARQGAA